MTTPTDQYTPQKTKRPVPVAALLGIAALIAAGLFWKARSGQSAKPGGEGGPGAARDNTKTVKTVTVTRGTLVQNLDVTGSLKANQDVNLGSKISGRVEQVYVSEGQRVRRGQLLVRLDEDDLRQQINAAKAGVQTAQVRLQQAQVGLPARVAQVGTNIDQAKTALETARARYKQALLTEPTRITTAQSQVDSARAAVRSANARVNQARTNAKQADQQTKAAIESAQSGIAGAQAALAEVRRGAREQQIAASEASVRLAEAQLRDADTELNRQKQLFAGGATARANVDKAQTTFEVAQANLESAKQNLSLVREGNTTEQTRQAEEIVRQREAALTQAQADRGRVLTAQSEITNALGALSQSQEGLAQAQANLSQIPITRQETRVAREAVLTAESGLRQAEANKTQIPVAQADIPAAQAAVESAQAQLEQAQINIANARIYSPIDGVVTAKFTDAGQNAGPGITLMNIVSLGDTYFEAQIPETQIAQIKVGQPARVFVAAVSGQAQTGYVSDIIPVADARLRQFRVRISLPDAEGLTPGAFARGSIRTQVISNALLVPDELVREDGTETSLLVASVTNGDNATVKRQTVKVGVSTGGQTVILGGVEAGAKVISGTASFEDGDKVKVAKE